MLYIYIERERDHTSTNTNDNTGWHYSCNATFLMRPPLCYALFAMPEFTKVCHIIRHV